MRTAVTGGAGAIGRHVVERLVLAGDDVVSIDLRVPDEAVPGPVETVQADVRDRGAIEALLRTHRIDRVVHLAAALPVAANADLAAAMETNVQGSRAVVEACAASEVAALVHFSSKAVYGRPGSPYAPPEHEPVPEWAPRHPVDDYGISKLAGEATVRAMAAHHGIPTVILRLGSTYGSGKGERHGKLGWLSGLVAAAVEGRRVTVHHEPDVATDLIYNGDVGRAAVAALAHIERGHVQGVEEFNIASGAPTSLAQVRAALEEVAGHDVIAARADDEEEPLEHLVVPSSGIVLDTRRAVQEMGFVPTFDLVLGLEDLIARTTATKG
jgi:UDP-glucose 4-epimerase